MKAIPHVMTPDEKRRAERGHYWGPQVDYVPSGNLTLLKEPSSLGVRAQWADGKLQRVEDRLNSFIAGLFVVAEAAKKRREEQERWQREWQEQQLRRMEEASFRREEEERIQRLKAQMGAWKECEDIRAYAAALEKVLIEAQGGADPESKVGQWIAWIRKYAGSVDPFREINSRNLRQGLQIRKFARTGARTRGNKKNRGPKLFLMTAPPPADLPTTPTLHLRPCGRPRGRAPWTTAAFSPP